MPGQMQSIAPRGNRRRQLVAWGVALSSLAALVIGLMGTARAQNAATAWAEPAADPSGDAPLIPPNVEGPAARASNGTFCYVGPHPVDTRLVAGPSWDATAGRHYRTYAPIDARLFALREGCYYFTGDPRDFGFAGQTYPYYGAHPVADVYGGGWCFMMGPHTHLWAPRSPSFTIVGSWYYWHGPFDPYFWAYWPYYSFYYRTYYPGYYGGGRLYRGGGWRVAPPIHSLPAQAWRTGPTHGAPVFRGGAPVQALRAPVAAGGGRTYVGQGIRPVAPVVHPAAPPFRPAYAAPARPFPAAQHAGGNGIHRR
jgi:hypothetical protein